MSLFFFPFPRQLKKQECEFKVQNPDEDGIIKITLQLNTINDSGTYNWNYGSVKDYKKVGPAAFFKPLKEFRDELANLQYAWEWQPNRYANGKYIKGSILYAIPVFDGKDNIMQMAEDEPFPAMQYIKSLKWDEENDKVNRR